MQSKILPFPLPHSTAFCAAIASVILGSIAVATAQTVDMAGIPTAQSGSVDSSASLPTLGGEVAVKSTPFNYTIGGALMYAPAYLGADTMKARVRPFFAAQYGRWSFADSRATAVTDFGRGASYALADHAHWKVGVGLRVDNGRKSKGSPELVGFDDVDQTLRGRLSASWMPRANWTLSSSLQTDLLGRKGGSTLGLGANRTFPISSMQRVTLAAAASLGDQQNMMTYFGVDSATAQRSGKRQYSPGAGFRDVGVGVTHNLRISERWFVMSSVGVARLVGGAADSPITRTRMQSAVTLSVAYHCCDKR